MRICSLIEPSTIGRSRSNCSRTRPCRSMATIGRASILQKAPVTGSRCTGMLAGFIKAYLKTNFTEDVMKFAVPTPIVQDDDQIVPIDVSARASARLVRNPVLKAFPNSPDGLSERRLRPAQRRSGRLC